MYLTWQVEPSAVGTKFSFHWALRPGVPIADGIEKSNVLSAIRRHAEGDVHGLKAFCEAEARAQDGKPR